METREKGSRIEDYMMTAGEAAIYLDTTEKTLVDTGEKWGLDIIMGQETRGDDIVAITLFFPQQIHDLKIEMLTSRPLITAGELARLAKSWNNLL